MEKKHLYIMFIFFNSLYLPINVVAKGYLAPLAISELTDGLLIETGIYCKLKTPIQSNEIDKALKILISYYKKKYCSRELQITEEGDCMHFSPSPEDEFSVVDEQTLLKGTPVELQTSKSEQTHSFYYHGYQREVEEKKYQQVGEESYFIPIGTSQRYVDGMLIEYGQQVEVENALITLKSWDDFLSELLQKAQTTKIIKFLKLAGAYKVSVNSAEEIVFELNKKAAAGLRSSQ